MQCFPFKHKKLTKLARVIFVFTMFFLIFFFPTNMERGTGCEAFPGSPSLVIRSVKELQQKEPRNVNSSLLIHKD